MQAERTTIDQPSSQRLVQVSLPPDMIVTIDSLAAKARVGRSTMIRTLLAQHLDALTAQKERADG